MPLHNMYPTECAVDRPTRCPVADIWKGAMSVKQEGKAATAYGLEVCWIRWGVSLDDPGVPERPCRWRGPAVCLINPLSSVEPRRIADCMARG